MNKEVKAALVAVAAIIMTLFYAIVMFRVVVPSILEAHFDGSSMVAFLAGFTALLGLALLVYAWVTAVSRMLKPDPIKPDEKEANGS
jgi:hypothetical protein